MIIASYGYTWEGKEAKTNEHEYAQNGLLV